MKNFQNLVEYINNNDTVVWVAGLNLLRWANDNAPQHEKSDFMECFDGDFSDLDNKLGNSQRKDWFSSAPNWDALENMEY